MTLQIVDTSMEWEASTMNPSVKLPALRECSAWSPPNGVPLEPRVTTADQAPFVKLQTPPPSPSDIDPSPRLDFHEREPRHQTVGHQLTSRSGPAGPSSMESSPIDGPGNYRQSWSINAPRRGYSSAHRGKQLRNEKQYYWREIERLLIVIGLLRDAKELHGGNKGSSKREFEEKDILKEVNWLLKCIIEDPKLLACVRMILRHSPSRRESA